MSAADLSLGLKFGKKDAENFESDYHVDYEETPYEHAHAHEEPHMRELDLGLERHPDTYFD